MAIRANRKSRKLNPGVYARPDGKYQAHIAIPADVRFAYGRDKRVLSLKTDDPDEANRRHAKVVADHNAAFELLRRGTASKAFEAFAVRLHQSQSEVIADGADRALMRDGDNPWLSTTWRERLDSQKPDELAATVGWAADWFYADQLGVDPDELSVELRSSLAYRQVMRECAEVLKDSWRAGSEAEKGRTISPPRHPALTAAHEESPDGNRATDDRATWPLSRYHAEVYVPKKAGEIGPGALKGKLQTIQLFNALIGDPPLHLLSRAQIKDFQSKLKLLPDLRAIPASLKDKSLAEIADLQASGETNLKRQGATTVDKHVRNIKATLAEALDSGHIRLNPALGMKSVKPTELNAKVERRPFTRIELQTIFAHPIFAGCEADRDRGRFRPGQTLIRDERFWIPVLCFLTGARAMEIAGLEKSEVTVDGDQARIDFKFTPLRRLKNKDSERVIPLHPWAMKLGFGDYVASLPSDSTLLFPGVVGESRGDNGKLTEGRLNASGPFRLFNRTILKHVGLERDPTVSLHSFRHVFEEAMTGRGITEEDMFRLTGRAVNGSRRTYTDSLPHDGEARELRAYRYRPMVNKIDFGGVDISSLFVI